MTPSARGTKGGKVGGPIRARNRRNGWHEPEPSAAVRKLLDRMRDVEKAERALSRGAHGWFIGASAAACRHAADLLRDLIREAERG